MIDNATTKPRRSWWRQTLTMERWQLIIVYPMMIAIASLVLNLIEDAVRSFL